MPIENLPDDVEALKRLVLVQSERLSKQESQLQQREGQVLHLSAWVDKLKLQIAVLKRMRFGRSSEQLDAQIAQLELIVDDLEESQGALAQAAPIAQAEAAPTEERQARTRKLMPEHLAREVLVHGAPCACPQCGGTQLRAAGQDVAEQLEFVPEHFKVIRHVRPKFSCMGCQMLVQAAAPARALAGGRRPSGACDRGQVP